MAIIASMEREILHLQLMILAHHGPLMFDLNGACDEKRHDFGLTLVTVKNL